MDNLKLDPTSKRVGGVKPVKTGETPTTKISKPKQTQTGSSVASVASAGMGHKKQHASARIGNSEAKATSTGAKTTAHSAFSAHTATSGSSAAPAADNSSGGITQGTTRPLGTLDGSSAASAAGAGSRPTHTHHTPQAISSPAVSPGQPGIDRGDQDAFMSWTKVTRKGGGKNSTQQPPNPTKTNPDTGLQIPSSASIKRRNKRKRRRARASAAASASDTQAPSTGEVGTTEAPTRLELKQAHQAQAEPNRPGLNVQFSGAAEQPQRIGDDRRPVGRDRVAAKRSLNETVSPQVERKRPCLAGPQRVAGRSYAQATSAHLCVAVTCARTGRISRETAEKVVVAIHKAVLAEAWASDINQQEGERLSFNGKPLVAGGVIKLWCVNEHSRAWLERTVPGLETPDGISLVVKSQAEVPKLVKCGILIPDDYGSWDNARDIGRMLHYQNPWAGIREWSLYNAIKQAAAWFLLVGVPEDRIPALLQAGRRLNHGLGTVYVSFRRASGRYTSAFPGQGQGASQETDATRDGVREAVADPSATATKAGEEDAPTPGVGGKLRDATLDGGPDDDMSLTSDPEEGVPLPEDLLLAELKLGADEGTEEDGVPLA